MGMRGILGMKTSSPLALPVIMVASKTCAISLFTVSLVPLHSFGGSRFHSNVMGAPTFSRRLYGGIPGGSSEFRNSVDIELLDRHQKQCPVTCKTALDKVSLLTVCDS